MSSLDGDGDSDDDLEPVSLTEDVAELKMEKEKRLVDVGVAAAVSLGYIRHAPRVELQ